MNNLMNLSKKDEYRELNTVADNTHTVLFGADTLSKLPVAELIYQFGLNISACNRSVPGLRVKDAAAWLDECVFQLCPSKVFLNFGEVELSEGSVDKAAFLADYAALIDCIQERQGNKVYVLSIASSEPEAAELNAALRALAEEKESKFVDVTAGLTLDTPLLGIFRLFSAYMRDSRVTFGDLVGG